MTRCIFIFVMSNLCVSAKTQTNAAKNEQQIKDARAASNAALLLHNVDLVVKCMAPEFIMVTGNAQQFVGKEAVTARWKEFFITNPHTTYIRTPLQVIISKNDTLAFETGTWRGINSYSAGGNYTAMWCKRNNVWLTRAELYVSLEK